MKLTGIETFVVGNPPPHFGGRYFVFVKLSTDNGSTGLGEGIAIPHARVENLSRIQLAYLRLKTPIPYGAPDGKPVSDVLVLLVPKQATEEHLWILAETAQMFADHRFVERLRACRHPIEVKSLFEPRS